VKPLLPALLAVLATTAPRATAMPPPSRTLQGVVAAVEPEYKRFTVRTEKTPAGVSLKWGPQTDFVRDGKFTAETALKRGQQVTVRYRWPFFGPKAATRVFVLSEPK
jgi:hypothetical protein